MDWFAPAGAGRWEAWAGLPIGLALRDVEAELGSATARHERPPLTVHELGGAARAWVRDGDVVMVELDEPAGGTEAMTALGPPEEERPARYAVLGSATTEHVWPSRGLVLVTAAAYDHGLPGPAVDTAPRLVHAELFVPTDAASWAQGPGRWRWPPPPHRF